MKDHLRYEVYSDEEQRVIRYCSNKQDAIVCAYEFMRKYGPMSVIRSKTGEIVFETHPDWP